MTDNMSVLLTMTMHFRAPAATAEEFIQGLGEDINRSARKYMVETLPDGEISSKPIWPGEG
jgi:hypothetical protein